MELLDRVKLIDDYKLPNNRILSRGTVGTIREIKEETVLIQINIPNMPIQVLIPIIIVERCELNDLKGINYEDITPRIFHKGNFWSIRMGFDEYNNEIYKTGVIVNYQLQVNENNDKITIHLLDDIYENKKSGAAIEEHVYKKQYMELFASYTTILN